MMRLERMNSPEVEAYFKDHKIALLSVGSIACHGLHNALGTDTLIPMKLLELVEQKSDVLILPTLPYGDCDWHLDWPGAVSIGSDLLEAVMQRICDCLYRWGCRYFVILNGHGGNTHALEKVCGYLDRKNAVGTVFNWWTVAGDLNPAWKGGHGAGEETAAMLAIDPKLVRKELICDNAPKDPTDELHACGLRRVEFRGISLPLPRTNRKITDNGWYGPDHPSTATVEWGTEMLNTTADFLVDFMRALEKIPLDAE